MRALVDGMIRQAARAFDGCGPACRVPRARFGRPWRSRPAALGLPLTDAAGRVAQFDQRGPQNADAGGARRTVETCEYILCSTDAISRWAGRHQDFLAGLCVRLPRVPGQGAQSTIESHSEVLIPEPDSIDPNVGGVRMREGKRRRCDGKRKLICRSTRAPSSRRRPSMFRLIDNTFGFDRHVMNCYSKPLLFCCEIVGFSFI